VPHVVEREWYGDVVTLEKHCPRCTQTALTEHYGALLEDVCARCHGRLLDAATAAQVCAMRGLSMDLVRELVQHYRGGPARCPACSGRMALVPLRGVDVDWCTSCGCAWLDDGELVRLSGAAVEELSPQPAPESGPPTTSTPTPRAPDDARFAVVLTAHVPPPQMIEQAFASAGIRTSIDARLSAKRAVTTVVVDDATELDANALAQALVGLGVPARVVSASVLRVPPCVRTQRLALDGTALLYTDALLRVQRVPLASVVAVSVFEVPLPATVRVEPGRGTQAREAEWMKGSWDMLTRLRGHMLDVSAPTSRTVERPALIADVLAHDDGGALLHLRCEEPRFVHMDEALLRTLVDVVQGLVPQALGPSARAFTEGQRLRASSPRELDRELGAIVLRARGP
jgi:Zn-finger nucleic acid-binding protein/ribosomal protein S27AE